MMKRLNQAYKVLTDYSMNIDIASGRRMLPEYIREKKILKLAVINGSIASS